jgi:hypothetical protein
MTYIGQALFLRHRTIREVLAELDRENVIMSSSAVSDLARKFILCLAIAHKESGLRIKDFMTQKGGYILHLDGLCEGGSPHLISVLDEISGFVLGNIKIPTENAAQIVPLLEDIKRRFGKPHAIVHDMGRAILKAVAEVFGDVRNFICHFHFLRDIGKDVFGAEYAVIRKQLKIHGVSTKLRYRLRQLEKEADHGLNFDQIREMLAMGQFPDGVDESLLKSVCYVLILWALDGKHHGDGFGFPFDRPHLIFYQRLKKVNETVDTLKQLNCNKLKPVLKLSHDLQEIIQDVNCHEILPRLLQKIEMFDTLRTALQIALPDSAKGLNDTGQDVEIKTIEQGVSNFRTTVMKSKIYEQDKGCQKMIAQIDTYWDKLFADPICVETPTGTSVMQPQRTNNILERFFRDCRKGYRRRTGNNKMIKILQTMLADTPLVKNLENPDYMKILLNGKANLEERLAEIDVKLVRDELEKAKQTHEKIPAQIKKIIKSPKTMGLFLNLFSNENTAESNGISAQ